MSPTPSQQPPSQPAGSSKRKQPTEPADDPVAKRQCPSTTKKSKGKGSDVYHIKRKAIPDDAQGVKVAFETHLRLLMGALSNTSVPEPPDADIVNRFEARFTSITVVRDKLNAFGGSASMLADRAICDALTEVRRYAVLNPCSNTALNIGRIPDHSVRLIFAIVHEFNLPRWSPDFLSTPTSLYNSTLEAIAIYSFEQAATACAYDHLKVNLAYVRNTRALKALYHNFVWSYMRRLVVKEMKTNGAAVQAVADNKAYKRRAELTNKRATYLRTNGFQKRIVLLTNETECTSDDERDPNGPGFQVYFKRARNPHVTDFFRTVDAERAAGIPLRRGQRYRQPEPRIPHPQKKESTLSARIPDQCPLDWFDPVYFNSLDLSVRAEYIDAPIALPAAEDVNPKDDSWRFLPDDQFMEQFGNKVKARYALPTEEELEVLMDEGIIGFVDDDAIDPTGEAQA